MSRMVREMTIIMILFAGCNPDLITSRSLQGQDSANLVAAAKTDSSPKKLADRGLDIILNRRYLPPDFDQETFDQIWQSWPEGLREKARKRSADQRRQMAFRRYGLTPRKEDPKKPLQFVVDKNGQWAMNCFSCHGGSLYGSDVSYPGLPNNRVALETLYEDLRLTKQLIKKPLSLMDFGSAMVPMGGSVGTTNAVIFGVSLMALRDKDLNLKKFALPPIVLHHDMDAPPWWNYKRKKMIYIDGFTAKHHRALMPFMMVRDNDRERFISFEADFRIVQKFIESVKAPAYTGPVDAEKVTQGKKIYAANCAQCHGDHDNPNGYPEMTVEMSEIGTDEVRQKALSKSYRMRYGESWLGDYGKIKTIVEPKGYVAPPLNGIWASAPYLHNGSVPTLRAVLDPTQRPAIWIRSKDGFDEKNVGLMVQSVDAVPKGLTPAKRRRYFDTSLFGKSNAGHEFGKDLNRQEQDRLLEYLKTL